MTAQLEFQECAVDATLRNRQRIFTPLTHTALKAPGKNPVALVHNIALSQVEAYLSGQLAGYLRYSMRGAEIWVLYLHGSKRPEAKFVPQDLISLVLDDAGRHRIAVHPYCLEVRTFMRDHPTFLQLVPQEWRARFRLPLAREPSQNNRAGSYPIAGSSTRIETRHAPPGGIAFPASPRYSRKWQMK